MKKIDFKGVFNSFRARILFSFLLLKGFLVIWIAVYLAVNGKETQLQEFSSKLSDTQNHFLASNRFLQHFMLAGYQQSSFYQTKSQSDIDTFILSRENDLLKIKSLQSEAQDFNLQLSGPLDSLYKLNIQVLETSKKLKEAYYTKGFKDFGVEGKMRIYAHLIEDSTDISKASILQLRRHEKDFLLRGEKQYAKEFSKIITPLLKSYIQKPKEYRLLKDYKESFEQLVSLYENLGLHKNEGKYNEINLLLNVIDEQYTKVNISAAYQIGEMQDDFFNFLIIVSIFSVITSVVTALILSKKLAYGISDLDRRLYNYIKSRFKNENEPKGYQSNITEIGRLNKDFDLLRKTLKETLENLELSYKQEKSASEAKGTFLANMSHEIRTPLNGIIGMAHILKSSKLNDEQKEQLETLEFSTTHLLELINTILDHSKIEAGKMQIETVSFDLQSDLTKLIKIFGYRIIEKNIKLKLNFNADNTNFKLGDSIRLQQILINLINNAVKFTIEGEITVTITEISIDKDNQKLRFEIADTGIGISKSKILTLFEAFEQGDASITRHYGGTGLGLTISNQLIQLLGSNLEVKSTLGVGSVFSFDLTLKQGEIIKKVMPITTISHHEEDKIRVLLVEDNLINQKVFTLLLEKNNATVTIANNGLEAFNLYDEQNFDLIFMDIQMPVMDGLVATERIRNHTKNKINYVPIVAITANAFNEDRDKAFKAGMDDFLTKPVNPLELKSIIEKYNEKVLVS